jgi:hypothetical protein
MSGIIKSSTGDRRRRDNRTTNIPRRTTGTRESSGFALAFSASLPRSASRAGFEASFAAAFSVCGTLAGVFAFGWEFAGLAATMVPTEESAPGFVGPAGSEDLAPGFSSSMPSSDMAAEPPRPA